MLINDFLMDFGDHKNIKCEAPCSMYGVLLGEGLIPDPFVGMNEAAATELSREDVTFRASFTVGDELEHDYCELVFHGLDTICDIILNGVRLRSVKNMHRTYRIDVKERLRKGENTLELRFHSPIEYFEDMEHRHHMPNCYEGMAGSAHLRKALYMSGWDWGPTLPDMGIFRQIELVSYDTDAIDSFYVRQRHRGGSVTLNISVETLRGSDCDIYAECDGRRVRAEDGTAVIEIAEPRLWWVRGYGEQNLYDVTVYLEKDGETVDVKHERIGLRTVDVSRKRDKYGREFTITVNGVPIFAKGANYIPNDNIISRISSERLRATVDSAVFANFNCLRVWGGGYYPEDELYDICDEYGLLIWQDIMVACAGIWMTDDMKEEMRCEAIDNIKRFRNHASFGILCGNNEIEDQMEHSVWGASLQFKLDYIALYENLLSDVAYKYAPDTFYWPSSPSAGGGLCGANSDDDGDTHYWEVWHGEKPFKEYRKHYFRFCSEFGFQSFPCVRTIRAFAEESDLNPFSRVMESHQKNASGNKKILTYLSETYKYPYKFEDLVYLSQLLQAEAIKCGVEHFRRIRDCCKGSIYWQLNDCWPVASWSSVDYFGRYKALHYYARRFYAPVTASLFLEGGEITACVMNESLAYFEGSLRLRIMTPELDVMDERVLPISVAGQRACDIITLDVSGYDKYSTLCMLELYDPDGVLVVRQSETLTEPKHFSFCDPHVSAVYSREGDRHFLTLTASAYAKDVCIELADSELKLSDNYFDLADDAYRVEIFGTPSTESLSGLSIKTLYDV